MHVIFYCIKLLIIDYTIKKDWRRPSPEFTRRGDRPIAESPPWIPTALLHPPAASPRGLAGFPFSVVMSRHFFVVLQHERARQFVVMILRRLPTSASSPRPQERRDGVLHGTYD